MASVQNTQRITSLFSGMDTDSLVKGMLTNQQMKLDKLSQTKTRAEWRKETITDFNSQLRQFIDNFGSALGKNNLVTKSSYASYTTEMAKNTTAFTVKGSSGAKAGSYSLRVDQVATAASTASERVTNKPGGLAAADLNKSINQLTGLAGGNFSKGDSETFGFSINGKDFTFKYGDSLNTIMSTVNKSGAGVTMSYSQITDKITLTSNYTGASNGLEDPGAAPAKPADFTAVAPSVDDYSGGAEDERYIQAQAEYDRLRAEYEETMVAYNQDFQDYKQQLTAFNEDSKRGLTIDDTDNFLSHFGFGEIVQGQDALVSVNGGAAMSFASNQFTLDGLEFNLNRATNGETFEFSIGKNTQAGVDNIKAFVEEFNKLVKTFFDAHTEKKNYKFDPLTDEQKKDLTEKEVEEWDKEARSGLMARDSRLGNLLNGMRKLVGESFGGEGKLSSIGINLSEYKVGEAWSLEIDTEKLTKALESNPDAVYNILGSSSKSGEGGFVSRLSKVMDGYVASTKSADLQNLTQSISDYTKRIKEQEDKMYDMSERYYKQYAKLETALGQMQSQTNQLTNLFGSSQ